MSEPDVSDLISVTRAIEILDAVPLAPRIIELPLADAADHRLAQGILADRDQPPFDKALMDGFAVRAADLASIPITLPVAGEIAAGASSPIALAPHHAIALMTGAPLPPGADTVIPIEDIAGGWSRADPAHVMINRDNPKSRNISARGADCRAGEIVLPAKTLLTAASLAVAASVGAANVRVFAPPRITLLSTGDEIIPYTQSPATSQIRNSNSIMLTSLLQKLGATVRDAGIVPDTPAALRAAITSAAANCDILFLSGGMSMGRHDHAPATLRELGFTLQITKLRIKPGKPFIFATPGDQRSAEKRGDGSHFPSNADSASMTTPFVFGLPGNPVSAFVCTLRLASRLIARMTGANPPQPSLHALLAEPLAPNGPREFYQPLQLTRGDATPLPWRGSADIFTLARADAFLIRPENAPALPVGAPLLLLPIPGRDELRS